MSLFETRAPGHGMAAGLPRPEPSPARKMDEEMKRKRRLAQLRQFLVTAFLVGLLGTAAPVTSASARTSPVYNIGDPTDVDGAPAPGPNKSASVHNPSSLGPYQSGAGSIAITGKVRTLMLFRFLMASLSPYAF